ncbi:MAG TPA: MarR family transcriptional regulator [Rhizobiales bacterium]|nr:MarR family transcriptional regulator [Hyphomicrobiales bacterium]
MQRKTNRQGQAKLGDKNDKIAGYRLGDQIGHLLRKASQRHSVIFADGMLPGLTPTRFAAMVVLFQKSQVSQNQLGRDTAMDAATIKGVVDRLKARGLVKVEPDPGDARRNLVSLTEQGSALIGQAIPLGCDITNKTLSPLNNKEQTRLLELLNKII